MTPTQSAMLAAIRRLTVDGVAPSLEELRQDVGLASKSGVHRVLTHLEREGVIMWTPHKTRSVVILEDAVSVAVLNAMSDEALRSTIAHASGILAHRNGEYAAAMTARRVPDALLRAPGRCAP